MEAAPKRRRHKMHGKRGSVYVHAREDGSEKGYVWQACGDDIIRGHQRSGLKCGDLSAETVFTNETTSPRVEIPRIVIETMHVESNHLRAGDIAAYWRLFAAARKQGIANDVHSIKLGDIVKYLGLNSLHRAKQSIERLSSATMTLRLNQPGARGTVRMQMIELLHDTDDLAALRGHDELFFQLPEALTLAVLESRDYAWVDLNALSRFKSKFAFPLYLKLCLEAGKHRLYRSVPEMTKAEFRAYVGMPEKTQASVLDAALQLVCNDLSAISGVRRRFPIAISFEDGKLQIVAGSAAKKLREMKPAWIAPEMATKQTEEVYAMPAAKRKLYPSLTRFRQAETAIGAPAYRIFGLWSADLHGATSYPNDHIVGMTGREFMHLIEKVGADEVMEFWADKRDFEVLGIAGKWRDVEVVEHTTVVRVPTARVLNAPCLDELIRNHGVAVADDPLPPKRSSFAEVDDDEIDF
ncbi:replication initiation protein [Ensifer aridi]|uniref:replication initiation protein n=1 Tax=Ensifer aridi TaxID=1708715 RepID=UPI00047B5764|nr:replication initiation protein [Ensifer aridi]